jgi:hypothetical protein
MGWELCKSAQDFNIPHLRHHCMKNSSQMESAALSLYNEYPQYFAHLIVKVLLDEILFVFSLDHHGVQLLGQCR